MLHKIIILILMAFTLSASAQDIQPKYKLSGFYLTTPLRHDLSNQYEMGLEFDRPAKSTLFVGITAYTENQSRTAYFDSSRNTYLYQDYINSAIDRDEKLAYKSLSQNQLGLGLQIGKINELEFRGITIYNRVSLSASVIRSTAQYQFGNLYNTDSIYSAGQLQGTYSIIAVPDENILTNQDYSIMAQAKSELGFRFTAGDHWSLIPKATFAISTYNTGKMYNSEFITASNYTLSFDIGAAIQLGYSL